MKTSTLIRWSGLAAIAGGLLLIPGAISSEPVWQLLGMIGALALTYGLIGIYAVQVERSGLVGFLGFVFAVAGSFFLTGSGEMRLGEVALGLLAAPLLGLGIVLLAVATLSSGQFPRWIPWIWIASVAVGVPSVFVPSLQGPLATLGSALAGLGMAAAGYRLWSRAAE